MVIYQFKNIQIIPKTVVQPHLGVGCALKFRRLAVKGGKIYDS